MDHDELLTMLDLKRKALPAPADAVRIEAGLSSPGNPASRPRSKSTRGA